MFGFIVGVIVGIGIWEFFGIQIKAKFAPTVAKSVLEAGVQDRINRFFRRRPKL